jgi:PAS domain S-box-containing protein
VRIWNVIVLLLAVAGSVPAASQEQSGTTDAVRLPEAQPDASSRHAPEESAGSHVLVLHSYHFGSTWVQNISRGIRSAFADQAGDVELHFEFMDARRLGSKEHFRKLQELYLLKYRDAHIDLIICSDDLSLGFMLGLGTDVFPEVPIVFCSVSAFEPSMRHGRQLTGLVESLAFGDTLDVALRLHPETTEVVVVTDMTQTGQALKANAAQIFGSYSDRLDFRYLEDLSFDELQQELGALSDGTIVFLLTFSRDRAGRVFSRGDQLQGLFERCPAPTYSVWELYLGLGIVGGRLTSGEEEGRRAGEIALRILAGERASDIPLARSPTRYVFDHRQFERFAERGPGLPEGSEVINLPRSFLRDNWKMVASVAAAMSFLLVVIGVLSWNIAVRRRAEATLRESEERYRTLVEAIPITVAVFQDDRLVFANPAGAHSIGIAEPSQLEGRTMDELMATMLPEDRDEAKDRMRRAEQGEDIPYTEFETVGVDGARRTVESRSVGITLGGRSAVMVIRQDISERKKAEEALRESEQRFRTTFEQAAVGVAHVASEGRFLRVNQKLCDIVGYSRDEMLQLTFQDITHPDDLQKDLDYVRQVLADEIPTYSMEKRYYRKDGSIVWVNLTVSLVRGAEGEPKNFISVIEDISDRKRAEEALHESQGRLEGFYAAAFEGVAITAEGRMLDVNQRLAEMYGYSPEELIGKEVMGLVYEEDRELVQERIRSGYDSPYEHRGVHRDGSILHLEVQGHAIQYQGRPCRATTIHDITERKGAEDALRESEERYRALVESSPYAIAAVQDGRVVFANAAAARLVGTNDPAEVIGLDGIQVFARVAPGTGELIEERFGRVEAGSSNPPIELELKMPDGSMIMSESTSVPIQLDGRPAVLVLAQDVTERRRAEREILESREQLRALAAELTTVEERERRRIGSFLHDQIGQDLAVLRMKSGELSTLVEGSTAENLIGEIRDVLDEAITNTRALTFDLSPPILYELGLEAALEWVAERLAEAHDLEIDFVDDGSQKPLAEDIAPQLFRMTRELLINVIKHAQARTASVKMFSNGDSLEILVEDDGVGFEGSVRSRGVGGGGFGLFSIRERLRSIGGRLEIDSGPLRGTRARIMAPLEPDPATTDGRAAE